MSYRKKSPLPECALCSGKQTRQRRNRDVHSINSQVIKVASDNQDKSLSNAGQVDKGLL